MTDHSLKSPSPDTSSQRSSQAKFPSISDSIFCRLSLEYHFAPVLCLSYLSPPATIPPDGNGPVPPSSPLPPLLLSGSEDGTLCLWVISLPNPKCVHSLSIPRNDDGGDIKDAEVTACALSWDVSLDQLCLHAASASKMYEYRLPSSVAFEGSVVTSISNPPSSSTTTAVASDLSLELGCGDEINQLVVSKRAVAAADDTGCVRMLVRNQLRDGNNVRRKIFTHCSEALCTSIAWCNRTYPPLPSSTVYNRRRLYGGRSVSPTVLFLSGGTDSSVALWNVDRPWAALDRIEFNVDAEGNQMCNPPFIHALSWEPELGIAASGCGDGTVRILQVRENEGEVSKGSKGKGKKKGRISGHSGEKCRTKLKQVAMAYHGETETACACVSFIDTLISKKKTMDETALDMGKKDADWDNSDTKQQLLVSAGNDAHLCLW
eukprot:CAMPEP_0113311756 /NCGR_PEP_ID=MMETSP0010_2-20120614/8854_1 /TAXON_ID=216773 ORGANISM="Corethron hystrix, Strain 308" /NCGR_SAMPLE_ID=MMETSP0010_2 /ASSEMBLY_ACC=CAM_ASM_000155 /LENGTH=432 /DNA_ID=CAMNT_0000167435 /DNA_START=30 /DNA_END=1325 /DNA_ORIENTATION=+ /assembly_acc=CAM_ASM_000155